MAKDPTAVKTAGPNTKLWLAPIGSTIPATFSTVFAGTWTDMGYLKDPPTYGRTRTSQDLIPWNATEAVRSFLESDENIVTINLIQTSRASFELYFGDLTYTTEGTGGISIEPNTSADIEKMYCLELIDGTDIIRMFWRRSVVSDVGALSMDKADAISYEVTLKRLLPASGQPFKIQSNVATLVTP